ncbi:MAG: M15 family metallopeptidase [Polyangiaceae bacterium]
MRDEVERVETATPESDGAVVYTPPSQRVIVIDDDAPEQDAYPPPRSRGPQLGPAAPSAKAIGLVVGGVLALAALNVWLLDRARSPSEPDAPAAAAAPSGTPWLEAAAEGAIVPPAEAASARGEGGELEDLAPSDDRKPDAKDKAKKSTGKAPTTVLEAIAAGCSTSSVDGLSRQIIAEGRCIDPDAFAPVPARKNLTVGSQVFLYLEAPARDHLLKVLDAHPTKTLVVNSALRTIAQQYLLSKWGANKSCGVELAATPGESNHESGLALDVREPGTWRPLLEAEGFRWLGPTDKVHFDYRGPGSVDHTGMDVTAFQRLWNRNHADDPIRVSGKFDAETEARLKKSPPGGFPVGAQCRRSEGTKPPPVAAAPKANDKPAKADKSDKKKKASTHK